MGGVDDFEEVMWIGFSYDFGCWVVNCELVGWLCDFNVGCFVDE